MRRGRKKGRSYFARARDRIASTDPHTVFSHDISSCHVGMLRAFEPRQQLSNLAKRMKTGRHWRRLQRQQSSTSIGRLVAV